MHAFLLCFLLSEEIYETIYPAGMVATASGLVGVLKMTPVSIWYTVIFMEIARSLSCLFSRF